MFLGYDKKTLQECSSDQMSSFCGVGNPFSIASIPDGSNVLDVGCGAGFDLFVASKIVGTKGSVCGIDLTQEMVERSRKLLTELAIDNVEVFHVSAEELPFESEKFDCVISNGAINLSAQKYELFKEIHRVMKTGATLQFADIVLDKELPQLLVGSLEAWTQ